MSEFNKGDVVTIKSAPDRGRYTVIVAQPDSDGELAITPEDGDQWEAICRFPEDLELAEHFAHAELIKPEPEPEPEYVPFLGPVKPGAHPEVGSFVQWKGGEVQHRPLWQGIVVDRTVHDDEHVSIKVVRVFDAPEDAVGATEVTGATQGSIWHCADYEVDVIDIGSPYDVDDEEAESYDSLEDFFKAMIDENLNLTRVDL